MPTAITIIKRTPYRGDATEEWSNTYRLTGTTPADSAAWLALFNALATAEKAVYTAATTIVRAYGYDSDAENATSVWSRDLIAAGATIAGTLNPGAGEVPYPGDVAAWIRWKTSRTTSKGKPIYLRRYYHDIFTAAGARDSISAAQKTAMQALGLKLRDGTFLDGRTVRGPGETSEVFLGHNVSVYPTTRTLKRRGRRPPSTG